MHLRTLEAPAFYSLAACAVACGAAVLGPPHPTSTLLTVKKQRTHDSLSGLTSLKWKCKPVESGRRIGNHVNVIPSSMSGAVNVIFSDTDNEYRDSVGRVCTLTDCEPLFQFREGFRGGGLSLFPISSARLADINADGVVDFLAASGPADPIDGRPSQITAWSGSDGKLLYRLSDVLGEACLVTAEYGCIPDCDGDLIPDIVVYDRCDRTLSGEPILPRWIVLSGRTGHEIVQWPSDGRRRGVDYLCPVRNANDMPWSAMLESQHVDTGEVQWSVCMYALPSPHRLAEIVIHRSTNRKERVLWASADVDGTAKSETYFVSSIVKSGRLHVISLSGDERVVQHCFMELDKDIVEARSAAVLAGVDGTCQDVVLIGAFRDAGPGCVVVCDVRRERVIAILDDPDASPRFGTTIVAVSKPWRGVVVGDPGGLGDLGNFVAGYSIE